MNSFKLGIFAEYIILFLYKICFYRILHRRYKTYVGEVDLIVVKGKTLVFIEVKARKYDLYDGIVSSQQIDRIRKAGKSDLFAGISATYGSQGLVAFP